MAVTNSSDAGIDVSVLVEGNATTTLSLGTLLLGDTDVGDTLLLLNRSRDDPNATFLTTTSGAGTEGYSFDKSSPPLNRGVPYKVEAVDVSLSLGRDYEGFVSYDARVKDASNVYSVPLRLGVHVLISPCFHGRCEARSPGGTCQDPRRAFSFAAFYCLCDFGFEGG